MHIFQRLLVALVLICCAALGGGAVRADPPLAEASGTVSTFNTGSQVLSVNTRVGVRLFQLNGQTTILLNTHSAAATDIRVGDEVTVQFELQTSRAVVVHLFREIRRQGKITAVGSTTLDLHLQGATISLRVDNNSRVELEGILLSDRKVLLGRRVNSVLEPGTSPLVLSLNGHASTANGPITAVNTTAKTITLAGNKPGTYTLDAVATIRRDGAVVAVTALVVGDTAKVAFIEDGTTLKALAVNAKPAPPAPAGKSGSKRR